MQRHQSPRRDVKPSPSTPPQGDPEPPVVHAAQRWWGLYDAPLASTRLWSVGPLRCAIERQAQELRIYSRDQIGADEDRVAVSPLGTLAQRLPDAEEFALVRHILGPAESPLEIRPALADRAVVSKPLHRFMLHPRQRVTVYVSSPLWLQARQAGSETLLADLPLIRPSDTWFGSSTRHGELCYASRTNARLNLNEIPVSPIRAITPVALQNNTNQPLSIDKICLPVSYLSLFSHDDGRLWTEPVTIACEQQNEPSALTIQRDAPGTTRNAPAIAAPRLHARSGLVHSLNVLFG